MGVRYVCNADYILREMAGECVLVPVGEACIVTNGIISMNETSSFLWKSFQTPRTIGEVIAEAREIYEDSDGIMEKHITECVEQYTQLGFFKKEEE